MIKFIYPKEGDMPRELRYILNVGAKVAHLRHNLHEECNTDQIKRRRSADTVPMSYDLCEHCLRGHTVAYTPPRRTA